MHSSKAYINNTTIPTHAKPNRIPISPNIRYDPKKPAMDVAHFITAFLKVILPPFIIKPCPPNRVLYLCS